MTRNDRVRGDRDQEPCGTTRAFAGHLGPRTAEWRKPEKEHRSRVEPYIHSAAHLYSAVVLLPWVKRPRVPGRYWRDFRDVLWNRVESGGTRACTATEVRRRLSSVVRAELHRVAAVYQGEQLQRSGARALPARYGWFITFTADR